MLYLLTMQQRSWFFYSIIARTYLKIHLAGAVDIGWANGMCISMLWQLNHPNRWRSSYLTKHNRVERVNMRERIMGCSWLLSNNLVPKPHLGCVYLQTEQHSFIYRLQLLHVALTARPWQHTCIVWVVTWLYRQASHVISHCLYVCSMHAINGHNITESYLLGSLDEVSVS